MLKGPDSAYRIEVIIELNINEECCPNYFVQNAALKQTGDGLPVQG